MERVGLRRERREWDWASWRLRLHRLVVWMSSRLDVAAGFPDQGRLEPLEVWRGKPAATSLQTAS